MPAVLDAPPLTAPDMSGYKPDAAQSIFNPDSAPPAKPETVAKPDAAAPNPEGQQTIDKPDAMKPEKKTGLDKLGAVKKPEEKKVEAKSNGATVEDKPVDMGNAKQLREAYDKAKVDMAALRAELDKVRPDAEKVNELRAELEGSREELTKLKAMNLNDEERKEYGSLREKHALDVLRRSTDYQQKLHAPAQSRVNLISEGADAAKLSPAAKEALLNAVDLPQEFARNKEMRRILKDSLKTEDNPEGLEAEDFNDIYNSVTAAARELNNEYYPKIEAAERQAMQIEQAARSKEKHDAETKTTTDKAAYQKEHEFVFRELTEKSLAPIMEDTDLAIEGTTLKDAMSGAEIDADPRERATQAQLAAAGPFLILKINKLMQQVHDLELGNKIRNGSSTSRSDALVKTGEVKKDNLSADEVFKSVRSFGPG